MYLGPLRRKTFEERLGIRAAAKEEGWKTQAKSAVPWAEVPDANKATMRKAMLSLLTSDILGGPCVD